MDQPLSGNGDWLTEVKFDGWRCQIVIDAGGIRVLRRAGEPTCGWATSMTAYGALAGSGDLIRCQRVL